MRLRSILGWFHRFQETRIWRRLTRTRRRDGYRRISAFRRLRVEGLEPRTVLTASFVGGPITTQNTLEDVASIVQFQIADDSVPLASLTLTATSDNQTVLPNANLALTNLGGGAYQLSSLPAANQNGSGLVTLTITGDGAPVTQSFTLNVTSVNDPPSFTKGADQSILNGAGAQSIPNWATSISPGPNETGQTLTFQVTNDHPSLFTVAPTINSSGTLTYTPSGVLGTAVVSVVLTDGGGTADGGSDTSATQTFAIQVAAPPAAAAGSLDPTFDGDGIRQLTSPQGASDQSREVVIQADGKMLALSMTFTGGTLGLSSTTFLKRYNVDGTLDTTFAAGGTFTLSDRYNLTALDVQSNGKILLAGDATIGSGIYVTRLNTDGSVDTTFGTAGVARISVNNVSSSLSERVGMTVQSDDRIIVVRGNHATPGSNMHFAVGRLTASGAVDTTFNSTGFVNVTVSASQNEFPVDAAVQSDGKIVVAGVTNLGAGAGMDFIALRFTSAGALDTSFNSVGYHVVNVSSSASGNDNANRVIIQSDGKILLGGFANADFGLVRFNTDGSLDSTFDGDGKVTTNFSGTDQIFGLLHQSDGTIIAGGTANGDFALARYTSTGALDTTFDGDGKATFAVASNSEQINGIALQSDGKIAFAGTSTDAQNLGDVVVGRFNSNGSIDTTFNGVGYTTSGFAPGSARITSSLQLADGRVLLGGFLVELNSSAAGRRAVWRLLADGSLDTTFGTGGVSLGTSLTQSTVSSLLVQSDGKILVLDATQSRLTRLNADGAVDTSFGSGGSLTLAPTYLTSPNGASSMALLGDGKILIAGAKLNSSTSLNEFAVVRVTSAGTVDATFDSDGLVTIDVGAGADFGRMIAVQSDGKILAGGNANNGTNDDFALVRLNADGSLDTSFGGAGKVVKAVGSGTDQARALLLQSDGKIVLGGQSSSDFGLVRFLADGTVDTSFGAAGVVVTQLTVGAADDLLSLVRQADGKYLAVGYATVSSVQRIAVVRYLADGALDSSFGTAGAVLTTVGANNNQGQTAYLQTDGKLVVGGFADGNSTASATMLRYVTAATPGAPSISSVADQTTLEDTTSAAINFSVSHPTLPAGSLNVTVASGNTALVPNGQLVLENLGNGNWRLTGTPVADQYGSALVTLTVSDGALSYAESFTLTVTPVNDPPSFTKGADQTALNNAGQKTIAGWATAISSGVNDPAQGLTFVVTTDSPSLFSVGPSISSNGTLTYTPSGVLGTAVVAVTLKDDGGTAGGGIDTSAPQTFTIQITTAPTTIPAGSLDTAFGQYGFIYPTLSTSSTNVDLARQSDGRILIAGQNGTTVGVWRFNADGSLDTSFGSEGFASNPAATSGVVNDIAIQSDGKIVVSTWGSDRILRFNADGSVDTTFDGDGVALMPSSNRGFAMQLQADDKILVTGFSLGSHNDMTVYRFNTTGSLDTTFDGDGIAVLSLSPTTNNIGRDIAVQPDGKIIVLGSIGTGNSVTPVVARLNGNGSLDASFDGDGMATVTIVSFDYLDSVALQSDGKIVLTGASGKLTSNDLYEAARLNSDGSFDTSFSSDGKATLLTGEVNKVLVDASGKLLLGGATRFPDRDLALARLLTDGSLDTSFGSAGLTTNAMSANNDFIQDMLLLPDGKVVVAGISGSPQKIFVARYTTVSWTGSSAPSIAAVADQATNEDVAKIVDFTVSHATLPVSSVSVTATSDDQTLIPNAGLALANLGNGNWRLTATPAANLSGSALITLTASDGTTSYAETFTLTVNAVNDAPVVDLNGGASGTGFSASFTEDGGPVAIVDAASLSLVDVDSATLAGATVTITNLLDGAAETLTANVAGTSLAAVYLNGVLTISGVGTVAEYQQALRTVVYNNSSQAPTATPRQVTFTVTDGAAAGPTATGVVSIVPANDAPTAGVNLGLALAEGATAVVDGTRLKSNDVDNTSAQLVYTVTNLPAHGTVNLNGAALIAGGTFTQADLDAGRVSYTHDSSENFVDQFKFTVSDGDVALPQATFALTITPVNDAPTAAVNLGLTLAEGATVVIDGTRLKTNDVDNASAQLVYTVTNLPAHGMLNLNGTALTAGGTFTQADLDAGRVGYTHDSSENFTDQFQFTVTDGEYALSEATFALVMTPVNDAPTAGANLGLTLAEGATAVVDGTRLKSNDVDNTAAQLVYTVTNLPARGTLNLNGAGLAAGGTLTQADLDAGRVTYSHDSSENFADSFQFTVTDGEYSLAEATFALTITPVNDAPTAGANLGLTLAEGGTAVINGGALKTNDVDNTFAQLVYTVTSLSSHGTVNLNGTALLANGTFTQADLDAGRVTYTHDSSENFSDNFQFTVTDGQYALPEATFALTITPVNDAPTAGANLGLTLAEGAAAVLDGTRLKTNDVDNTTAQLVYTVTNLPARGTLNLNGAGLAAGGTFTQADLDAGRVGYTHDSSENFTDSFKFTVTDGEYALSEATFALVITSVNDAPTAAVNFGLTLAEGGSGVVGGNLLRTDDVDNSPGQRTYTLTAVTAHGALAENGVALAIGGTFTQADLDAGLIRYTHDSSENFADGFKFTVSDGGFTLPEATFTLTITPVNDAPTAGLNLGLALAEGATAVLDGTRLSTNDVDNTTAQLVYTVTNLPARGTLNLNGAALAAGGTFTQADLDAGRVTYTHDSSENFSDVFKFMVADGEFALPEATFALMIAPVNDAPTVGVNSGLILAEGAAAVVTGGMLRTDDVDNATAQRTYALTAATTHGVLARDGAALAAGGTFTQADLDAGRVTYTHDSSENFSDAFSFMVSDGQYALPVAAFDITVTPVNDAPTAAVNLGLTLAEGATVVIDGTRLKTHDVDNTAAQLVYTVTSLPAHGTVNLNGAALATNGTFTQADLDAGRVTYAHDSSENFADSFKFTVTDGHYALSAATFALSITPVNDAPTAGANLGLTLAEGATVVLDGTRLKTNDVDNTPVQLVYAVTNLPTHGTVNLNGTALVANGGFTQADLDAGRVSYTHDSSENFSDNFQFTVTDGEFTLSSAAFAVTITSVNDAPTAGVNLGLTLAEGATAVVNGGLLQTHDVDNTAAQLSYTVVSPPTHGTLNLNGAALAAGGMFTQADLDAGNVTYTHDSSENFADNFKFVVADGEFALSEAAFAPTITPVNDAPTAGANLGLTLAEGATVVLNGSRLRTNDVDNTTAQLVYTVTNLPAHGTVNLNGTALATSETFTQADLDAGRVGYTHDSSENFTDQFQFTVTDGEYSLTSATFALNITPVNDAPTAGVNLGLTLAEGGTATIAGGLLQTNDVDDSAAELVYTVTNLPTHGTVNLNGAALAAGGTFTQADLDDGRVGYTHDSSENFVDQFQFTVTDGEYSLSEATFALVITPVNDAPVVAPQNFILYNKAVAGTIVGAVQAADRDAGQQRSFAIVGGNGALAINAATGVLTVVNSKLLVGTALNFAVRVTDDGVPPLATDAPISVGLRAADAPPTFAVVDGASAPLAVVNNQVKLTLDERTDVTATRNGLVIATLAAADVDEPGVVFPLTMTDKSGAFAFDAATGKLSIRDDAKLDYEKTRSFTLTFKATDHGLVGLPKPVTSTLTMTVQLTDRNDAPTVAPAATFKLKENNGAKVTVGTVKAADADGPAAFKNLQYAIVSQRDAAGDDVGIFSIDAARGTLMIAAAGALNYEARPQYTVVVRARDAAGLFADQTVTVQVIDVNEAVVLALLDAAQNPTTGLTVPENTVNGTLVGYLRIDNPDVTRPETFKITLGDNLGRAFAVGAFDAASRLAPITVFNVTKLNFEAIRNGQFTLSFSVSDSGFTSNDGSKFGGVTVNKTYNSLVTDVNEAPTAVTWKTVGLPSGAAPIPAGTLFGTALGVDPDKTPQAFTYSLPSATLNNDLFTIDPLTGQLRSSLALGRKGIFNLLIRVTDAGGLFFNQSVVIKT